MRRAIQTLENKKAMIESMKELEVNTEMTKEKYDSIQESLMIRKLKLSINPNFLDNFSASSLLVKKIMAQRKKKIKIWVVVILLILLTFLIIIGCFIIITLHS